MNVMDIEYPETEEEVARIVAGANAAGLTIEVRGGGTKLTFGRPVQSASTLSLARLTGITNYDPSELVMAARAGTPLAEIEALLAANTGSVVVVDEAYVDFGAESAVSLISRYPNLLVVQTLSKSRSLAGLRVGFALGDAGLIEALERIKNSFNSYPLDQLAIAGAAASFEDEAYFQHTRATVMESRRQLSDALAQRGFNVLPSSANFVFARHPDFGGADLAGQLRQRGVVVRHFNKPRIDAFLRITVGTNEQQQRLIAALDEILGS